MTAPLESLVAQIDAWLPQTQCRRCGYDGCLSYARAIAGGIADINRCPPGGDTTLAGLAALLHRPVQPLDPACGPPRPRMVASIEEAWCIGCTLCLKACPVDAIVGMGKRMHTVLASECTGCELCIAPCPTDCIRLLPAPSHSQERWPGYTQEEADRARGRTEAQRLRRSRPSLLANPLPHAKRDVAAQKKAEIRAAVARTKAKRSAFNRDG